MSYRLGVDLGTTYTAAALTLDGRVEMLSLGNRATQIASVLFIKGDGQVLVGEPAEHRGAAEPARLVREFKRRIGDGVPIIIGGAPYSPQSLLARVLAWVVEAASRQQGEPPDHVCVSYPANWGPFKQEILEQVVKLAGLARASTCTEPEAAAIAYASRDRVPDGARVAVYDLGGGTFDAAVLVKEGAGFRLVGTPDGIEHLGGIDFDAAICQHVLSSLGPAAQQLDDSDPASLLGLTRLRRDCVTAKENLSSDVDTIIPVALPGITETVDFTRAEFEQMVRPAITETVSAMQRALDSAKVTAADLHAIVLVGGSSRIPLVSQELAAAFGRPLAIDNHPKHDVAMGAAIRAAEGGSADPWSQSARSGPDPAVPSAPAPPVRAATPVVARAPAPPVAAWPGSGTPEPASAAPDNGRPDTGSPGTVLPGFGRAVAGSSADYDQSGFGPEVSASPGYGQPDSGSAGSASPGYGQPDSGSVVPASPDYGPSEPGWSAAGPPGYAPPDLGWPASAGYAPPEAGPAESAPPEYGYRDGVAPGQELHGYGPPDAGHPAGASGWPGADAGGGGWSGGGWPPGGPPHSNGPDIYQPAPSRPPAAPHTSWRWVLLGALVVVLLVAGGLLLIPRGDGTGGQAASSGPAAPPTGPPEGPTVAPSLLPQSPQPLADDVIVWPQQRDGNWDIATITAGGVESLPLIASTEEDTLPIISPDRRTIMYLHTLSTGFREVRVMGADGTGDRPLFDAVPAGCDNVTRPAFGDQPEPQLVLPCLDPATGDTTLKLLRPDGTLVRDLERGWISDPALSPDGKYVHYWQDNATRGEGGAIYRLPTDGSAAPPEKITPGGAIRDNDAAVSPKGDLLAITRAGQGIWTVGLDPAHKLVQLTKDGSDMDPSWSPDGSQIVFKRRDQMWLVNADGSGAKRLSAVGEIGTAPAWSPR